MRYIFLIVIALVSFAAQAQSNSPRDKAVNPATENAAVKSNGDFSGMLLITPDKDWKTKWETSPDTAPTFSRTHTIRLGERVFVLIFFSNPMLDTNRTAHISCDIKLIRPDSTQSVSQENVDCFRRRIAGDPRNVYLSAPVVEFFGEATDPAGNWTIEVTLHDNHRHSDVSLRASFDYMR